MKTRNLKKMCNAIILVTTVYGLTQLLYLATALRHAEFTTNWLIEMIRNHTDALTIVIVSIMFFMLAHNAKKGAVFTRKNEMLLVVFGRIIAFMGLIFMFIISHYTDESNFVYQGITLSILIGLMLVFFSLLLKIARNMQEENDLTI